MTSPHGAAGSLTQTPHPPAIPDHHGRSHPTMSAPAHPGDATQLLTAAADWPGAADSEGPTATAIRAARSGRWPWPPG